MSDWEDRLRAWAKAPGTTERDKCDNAVRAVKNAVEKSAALKGRATVFAQGSYCNRTSVPGDSDVDICVRWDECIFFDLPPGMTAAQFGISTPAPYPYGRFKNDLAAALEAHFGARGVKRGKKAFDIHENTYRVDADVVACFGYRWYYDTSGAYHEGTAFVPDGGERIHNYPQQNYDNGVTKNGATGERFKAIVRALKCLRSEMNSKGIAAAAPIPSYLIECLCWNVPNHLYNKSTYTADVRHALVHIFDSTSQDASCGDWREVNGFKYLFRPSQPWDRTQVNSFVRDAWAYLGF